MLLGSNPHLIRERPLTSDLDREILNLMHPNKKHRGIENLVELIVVDSILAIKRVKVMSTLSKNRVQGSDLP